MGKCNCCGYERDHLSAVEKVVHADLRETASVGSLGYQAESVVEKLARLGLLSQTIHSALDGGEQS